MFVICHELFSSTCITKNINEVKLIETQLIKYGFQSIPFVNISFCLGACLCGEKLSQMERSPTIQRNLRPDYLSYIS